jgi:hypothetical protein
MLRLIDQPEETPTLPARYYRRKAAEARAAEAVTTRAIKSATARFGSDFDRLADAADGAAQTPDPLAGVIPKLQRNAHQTLFPGTNKSQPG